MWFSLLHDQGVSLHQHVLFATTFALSFSLLELLVFEILDYFSRDFRHDAWCLTLEGTVILLVAVLPLSFCVQIMGGIGGRRLLPRLGKAAALWLGFLFFLARVSYINSYFGKA